MAFTPEDGTGLDGANSYVLLADADEYFVDRGISDWEEASVGERERALIIATDYIDGKYGRRWIGEKSSSEQGLDWPRTGALDSRGEEISGIPQKLMKAVSEAALLILRGTDLFEAKDRGGKVKRETVGPITTEYSSGAPSSTIYPAIVRNIAPLISGSSGLRIVR